MTWVIRICIAVLAFVAAMKVGTGYIHLCRSGSPTIEILAAFVTPLAAAWLVIRFRRLWLGIGAASLLIATVYSVREPYLDFAHSPLMPFGSGLSKSR
jgi:hypothetical protein